MNQSNPAPTKSPRHAADTQLPAVPALIREKETLQLVGLSKSTVRILTLKGKFPPSFKISERASARSRPAVLRWIEDRAAAAGSAQGAGQ